MTESNWRVKIPAQVDNDEWEPDFNTKHLSLDDSQGQELNGSGYWSQEVKAIMEAVAIKSLYYQDDWPFLTVDTLAKWVSSSPVYVRRKVIAADGTMSYDVDKDHPALLLLKNPNSQQTSQLFLHNICVEKTQMGNCFIYFPRRSKVRGLTMQTIPAETVQLAFNKEITDVSHYNILDLGNELNGFFHISTEIKPEHMVHLKRANPNNLFYGLSPFVPTRKSVLFNRYTTDYLLKFYTDGILPGIILGSDDPVSDKQGKRILHSMEQGHKGRSNSRKPMILPSGMKLLGHSPDFVQQGILELIENKKDIITLSVGVSETIMKLNSGGGLGTKELMYALKAFIVQTVAPEQQSINEVLTDAFKARGLLDPDEELFSDNGHFEPLLEDMAQKAEYSTKLRGVYTINELREMFGKPPVEGGDELSMPIGLNQQQQMPAAPFVGRVEEVEEEVEEQDNEEKKAEVRRSVVKAVIAKRQGFLDQNKKGLEESVNLKAFAVSQKYLDLFSKQAEPVMEIVIAKLKSMNVEKSWRSKGSIPDKAKFKATIKRSLNELEDELVEDEAYIDTLTGVLEQSYLAGLEVSPDLTRDVETQVLQEQGEDDRKQVLIDRQIETFQGVNSTTTDKILDRVANGVENNKTLDEISNDVIDIFQELSPARAETIARTEVLTAASIGQSSAIEDLKKQLPDDVKLKKIWVSAQDERVRESHQLMNGDIVDEGKEFDNGLRFPRDPNAKDASEVINCRCTWIVVDEEELNSLGRETEGSGFDFNIF